MSDASVFSIIEKERIRQRDGLELIASENFCSSDVRAAQGSVLTNKYAEGYPQKRYYGGCEHIDEVEQIAIDRLCKLFGSKYANVQPHSGASANLAVFFALLSPGDKVLGMNLSEGGHLTHGSPVNFSGKWFESYFYGIDQKSELISYSDVREKALEVKPKMIIAGASAYPRVIDFEKFREIADEVGAYLLVDMAHIAGLVAAGLHPSPIPHAHVTSSTTHKTLRGPRGGIIMTNDEALSKKINSAIFPGLQGGPLEHVIAAKAVSFYEALNPEFATYQKQVISNAQTLAELLENGGLRVVSGGTDNHLMLIDLTSISLSGKEAEKLLGSVNITCNKNMIPGDTKSPFVTSGIRLGTPALTSRGMKNPEMELVAKWILETLKNPENLELHKTIKTSVAEFSQKFPLP